MKLPLREGFIPPPNSVIAFSQHYLCFLSISQGIVLEIICISLIGVACVVIVLWLIVRVNKSLVAFEWKEIVSSVDLFYT